MKLFAQHTVQSVGRVSPFSLFRLSHDYDSLGRASGGYGRAVARSRTPGARAVAVRLAGSSLSPAPGLASG